MKTTYKFVDAHGNPVIFRPWETQAVLEMVDVTLIPNNDPEDPSADEIIFTIRLKEEND